MRFRDVLAMAVQQGGGAADTTAPTITSASTANNAENSVLAHTLTASESVTWSLVGGVDQAKFELSGSTLRWTSNGTKDFEAPDDTGANNTYIVDVRATDGVGLTANQTVTITVTDVVSEGAIIGHELVTNGDYSSSTGHTLTNMTIAASQCSGVGDPTQTDQVTSIETLVAGTYRIIVSVGTNGADFVYATVGGTNSGPIPGTDSTGFNQTVDVIVSSVTDQLLILSAPNSVVSFANWSCKRTV